MLVFQACIRICVILCDALIVTPVRKTNIPENEDNIDVCISDSAINGPLETPWRKTPEWNIKASIL